MEIFKHENNVNEYFKLENVWKLQWNYGKC